jgi:DNA-3-methyladenine glycosylase II
VEVTVRSIETDADVTAGVAALVAADPRLGPIAAVAGPLPLRRGKPGFEGLARIVMGQQVSTASAAAIFGRLHAAGGHEAAAFAALDDAALRACGLSAAKVRTMRAAAAAVLEGRLDLDHLASLPADEAHAALTVLPGVGPWTVDLYLLFCAGHPDVFPAGDLALQVALADGLALPARPKAKEVDLIAAPWTPWRSVAARLWWGYYRARREGREGAPL